MWRPWAASGRGMGIVAARSTQSLDSIHGPVRYEHLGNIGWRHGGERPLAIRLKLDPNHCRPSRSATSIFVVGHCGNVVAARSSVGDSRCSCIRRLHSWGTLGSVVLWRRHRLSPMGRAPHRLRPSAAQETAWLECCLTTRWSGRVVPVGRVCPRHGHCGRPLN